MRTLSTADAAVLATRDCVCHRKVKVANSAGTLIDFTTLETYDFVESVSWGGNVEETIANATVTFRREVEKLSLAPLHATSKLNILSGSYSPALAEGRLITIEVAVTAPGVTPSAWMEVFRGEIDKIDSGPDLITVEARDLCCRLMDRFIEDDSRDYGSGAGVAVETVMQSILTDNSTGETLWCPSSPGFVVSPAYRQRQESVLKALETLAQLFGGQLRHIYDSGTSAWRLKLSVPERTSPVSTYTFTADHYLNVERLATSREEVRNKIRGRFYNRAALDAGGQPTYSTAVVEDAASVAKYGGPTGVPRYMEIRLDKTDVINTASQMNALLAAALADLKDPLADFAVTMPLFPHVEVNDFYTWSANGVHFTSNQGFAAVSYEHSFPAQGQPTTRMELRGKPTIGADRWLRWDTRIAVQPANNVGAGPAAPTNVALTKVQGGLAVTWQLPTTGVKAKEWEVHVSKTAAFTIAASTLACVVAGDRAEVGDLDPGATYYVRVVGRDEAGNRGTAATEASTAAGYTSPAAISPMARFDSLIVNPGFEVHTDTALPFDGWGIIDTATSYTAFGDPAAAPAWGTVWTWSSTSLTGARALKLISGQGTGNVRLIGSKPFAVGASKRYITRASYHPDTGVGTGARLTVKWLDSSGALVAQEDVTTFPGSGSWVTVEKVVTAPANAASAVITVSASTISPLTDDLLIDNVMVGCLDDMVALQPPRAKYRPTGPQVVASSTATPVDFGTMVFDSHGAVSTTTGDWKFTVPPGWGGIYSVQAVLSFSGGTAGSLGIWLQKNSADEERVFQGPLGAGADQVAGSTIVQAADGDELAVAIVVSPSRTISASSLGTFIQIVRLGD